jgi:hypothetical protein
MTQGILLSVEHHQAGPDNFQLPSRSDGERVDVQLFAFRYEVLCYKQQHSPSL